MWYYLRPYRTRFILGTLIRGSSDVVKLTIPIMIGQIITLLGADMIDASHSAILWLLTGITLANLYHYIVRNIGKSLLYNIAAQVNFRTQVSALQHLFLLDWAWHEQENSGNKLKKIDRGGANLETLIRLYVDLLLDSVISTVLVMAVLFTANWFLGIMLLFFFVSFYGVSLALTRKVGILTRVMNEREEEVQGVIFESLNTLFTLKAMRLMQSVTVFLENKVTLLLDAITRRVVYGRFRDAILSVYKGIFLSLILGFTIWQVWQGYFAVGMVALVLFYFSKVEESAYEFSQIYNDFFISKLAIERLQEIFTQEPNLEVSGNITFPATWQTLHVQDLAFSYSEKDVLRGLTFSLSRGEKIGIVGVSGAGKSTLFKILLKMYDSYEGEVRFDHLSLREIDRASYVARIAYVPQEIELFNLSLKTNIAFSPQITQYQEDNIKHAASIARVADFSHKLKDGLDTLVGEKGVKLSGGERQRVGIARAVFRDPDILFLDEATSHLDSLSEQRIQNALHEVFRDITAIVIAHRLSTLQQMDRIIVLEQGRIAEQGSFEELLARRGVFYDMWQAQKF